MNHPPSYSLRRSRYLPPEQPLQASITVITFRKLPPSSLLYGPAWGFPSLSSVPGSPPVVSEAVFCGGGLSKIKPRTSVDLFQGALSKSNVHFPLIPLLKPKSMQAVEEPYFPSNQNQRRSRNREGGRRRN